MILYKPNGDIICELNDYELNESFMGESVISSTYESSVSIEFPMYSYAEYKGSTYKIYPPSKPKVVKSGSTGQNIGDAVVYDILLYSDQKFLTLIDFRDWILEQDDSDVFYTGSSSVSFFGTVEQLVNRIQANVNRYCEQNDILNEWVFQLDPTYLSEINNGTKTFEEKTITASESSCWDALLQCNDQFDLTFQFEGTVVTVGGTGEVLDYSLEYGKGKGLMTITRAYDTSGDVITRLRVLGAESTNLPDEYRSCDNFNPVNLIIPDGSSSVPDKIGFIDIDWNYDVNDPDTHVWRDIMDEYGVIEGSHEPYTDIYPSIEGATDGTTKLDIVTTGSPSLDTSDGTFTIYVNYPNFTIEDRLLSGETPKISIRAITDDGSTAQLAGYEFDILQSTQAGNKLLLVCRRNTGESTPLPSNYVKINAGDKFVYLGISMPDEYVDFAEERLLARGREKIHETNGIVLQYSIDPSNIFVDKMDESQRDLLRVGNNIPMIDLDLGLEGQGVKIQSMKITYGQENLPLYSFTLSNIKFKTLKMADRIAAQNQAAYNSIVKNKITNNSSQINYYGNQTATLEFRD